MGSLHAAPEEGDDLGPGAAAAGAEGGSGRAVGREFPTMFCREQRTAYCRKPEANR